MSDTPERSGSPRDPAARSVEGSSASRDWTHDLRARLVDLRLSPTREAEIVEELSQHLDDRYEELRAGGTTDADARRLVLEDLRDSGEIARRMRALSQARTPPPIAPGQPAAGLVNGLAHDLRAAVRAARQQPAFTAAVVLTLAFGLAVNTTVFTMVNAVVLRPLPFHDPDRVVRLGVANVGTAQAGSANLSYPDLQDWREAGETFEQIGGSVERGVSISGDDRPAAFLSAEHVTWNTFSLLGERPVVGRDFTAADDVVGAPPVVVLGGDLWRTRYGADPAIVGRTVRVSGVPATIVGVMPPGFGFPDNASLWLPVGALPEAERTSRGRRELSAYGRLRPGVTIEQAQAELAGIADALAQRYPETNRDLVPRVARLSVAAQFIAVLAALLGAVGFVLLIACANVANLLLARVADRSRDVTLRLALGASRWRIVRQLIVESLVLATAGGVGGLALAYVGVYLLTNIPPEAAPPYFVQFTMDRAVFAYLALLAVGSALLCSLVPAWHASRANLAGALNEAGRSSTGSRSSRRWTGAFVVAEVALALVLLTGAGLMMQNLMRQVRVDAGVDTSGLLQAGIDLRPYGDAPERRRLFLDRLEERLSSSSIVHGALASHMPMGGAFQRRVRIDGQPADTPFDTLPIVSHVLVGRDYFEVTGVPAAAGAAIDVEVLRPGDDRVVVNERFAAMFFEAGPVVGQRILLPNPPNAPGVASGEERWMTITGVVGNVPQRMLPDGTFDPVVYSSYAAGDAPRMMTVLARSPSGTAAATSFVNDQVQATDEDVPVFGAGTVDRTLLRQLWPQRVFGSLFVVFASMAMLLAACGLYAVTAYAVSRRTREIGVRVALGADGRRIWWTLTRTTLGQLGLGLVLGAAGAAAVSGVLPAILVGSDRMSPLVFAGVAGVLLAAGVIASSVPARRAMRVDPMTTLRAE